MVRCCVRLWSAFGLVLKTSRFPVPLAFFFAVRVLVPVALPPLLPLVNQYTCSLVPVLASSASRLQQHRYGSRLVLPVLALASTVAVVALVAPVLAQSLELDQRHQPLLVDPTSSTSTCTSFCCDYCLSQPGRVSKSPSVVQLYSLYDSRETEFWFRIVESMHLHCIF
jgi:hypothetical protein